MPRVARYEADPVLTEVTRQPQAPDLPSSFIAAGNQVFRSNIEAMQSAVSLAQTGLQVKQRVDTTAAEEALVSFERDKNNMFFNPDNGYFNTQGKDAYDSAETATQALSDLKKKYAEGLSENARALFDRSADVHITRGQADIARHSSRGLRAWEVSTVQAQAENTLENAALYWNQPDRLAIQKTLGRQAVIDAAELEGAGAEVTAERLQTYESTFAKASITAAMNSSAAEGQAMFEAMSSALEGPDKINIENKLKKKAAAEQKQANAQLAIVTGTNLANTYDSRGDIREEVNKIEDPVLRKETMNEAMRQFNLKKQAEAEAQAEAFEQAEKHVLAGGSAATMRAEDPEAWDLLSAEQQKSIEAGKAVATNWNTFSDLMTLPKEELAKVNPTEHFHQLAPAERNKLISAVRSAAGTGTSSDKIDHQVGRTRTSQTTSAIEQILGKKSKWNEDDMVKANAFYDLLDSEVAHREQLKGSPLTSQEYTDTLGDLTRMVTIERTAFGVDFLAPDVEQDITDVPPENLRILSKFLRDNGIPVTADNLIKAQRQATE